MRSNRLHPAVVALLACLAAAVAERATVEAVPATVVISGFEFRPPSVTIAVGETVTWVNDEQGISHTVSSDTPGAFDSGTLEAGGSFRVTFSVPGRFTYHCTFHPSMVGIVMVQTVQGETPVATPTATPTPAAPPATATTAPTLPATAPTTAPTPTASPTGAATPTPGASPAAPGLSPTAIASPTTAPPIEDARDDDGGGPWPMLLVVGLAMVVVIAAGTVTLRRR